MKTDCNVRVIQSGFGKKEFKFPKVFQTINPKEHEGNPDSRKTMRYEPSGPRKGRARRVENHNQPSYRWV